MYKSQAFTKKQLQSVVIPKAAQDYIVENIKTPIDVLQGFEILKKDSENFTKDDPQLQHADELFYDMVTKYMEKEQSSTPQPKGVSKEEVRIRNQNRKRRLRLLALKLKQEPQAKAA